MANPIQDQAEGLRRLLVPDFLRIVTVTSGSAGGGKTTTVMNLAAALARSGKDVLVIDENEGANNLGGTLGLNAHRDLLDVMRRDRTLDEVIIPCREGFRLLPAGRGLRILGKLNPHDQAHLIDCFGRFAQPVDVVLVDAAPGRASRLLPLNVSSHEVAVIVLPEPASITAAYALIKHISGEHGKRRFRVLVNKAGAGTEAQVISDNMAKVASRHLEASLDFMGFVPMDDKLNRSIRLGSPVIESFPAAASAAAFRRVAEALTCRPCHENERAEGAATGKGLKGFMQSLMQSSQNNRSGPSNRIKAAAGLPDAQVSHV
ncbi:MAG: AAA family ATPase [Nitrosospira sp.]|nr:AAA family ATPase [Nitrosospira sp.]